MSEYEKALLAAVQAELGEAPLPVKYPLPCGCHGPKYISKCNLHQVEQIEDDKRRIGVADLKFTHKDFTDLPRLVESLHAIKLQLISNPTKMCIIKINPEPKDETNASGASRPDEAAVPRPSVAKA